MKSSSSSLALSPLSSLRNETVLARFSAIDWLPLRAPLPRQLPFRRASSKLRASAMTPFTPVVRPWSKSRGGRRKVPPPLSVGMRIVSSMRRCVYSSSSSRSLFSLSCL
jgi:hypothetical protein